MEGLSSLTEFSFDRYASAALTEPSFIQRLRRADCLHGSPDEQTSYQAVVPRPLNICSLPAQHRHAAKEADRIDIRAEARIRRLAIKARPVLATVLKPDWYDAAKVNFDGLVRTVIKDSYGCRATAFGNI
jgi:hypothetical protein